MATPTVSEDPIVQSHYAAQIGVATTLGRVLQKVQTPASSPDYLGVVSDLVREFQSAAISLGVDYYGEARDAAGVSGAFQPPVIDPWSPEQIAAYIDAALADFTKQINADIEAETARVAETLALDAGTEEIFAAIDADPARPRWARVTRPGACAFCLLLATKGAVYRSEETASFRPHKGCQCDVQLEFNSGQYEATAHIRAAASLYSEATADLPRGADRFNAFRRALYAQRQTTG